jgi:hypothetical protein
MRPLGGVADQLDVTVAARSGGKVKKVSGQKKPTEMAPAERLAYSQDRYGQVKNWGEVEQLLGKAVDKNTQLPPGYTFYEKPAKRGDRTLFILRENADDGSFVPLMIEKGKIQAGKTRLSRGLDAMKANLKAVGTSVPDGYQLNHLIPDEVAQSNPLMIEALKRDLFDVDRASNLLPMPGEVRAQHPDLIGHFGSHPKYSNIVDDQLTIKFENLRRRFGKNIPDDEIERAIESVENSMHQKILKRDPGIPTRKDINTGTEVLSWQPSELEDSQFSA